MEIALIEQALIEKLRYYKLLQFTFQYYFVIMIKVK